VWLVSRKCSFRPSHITYNRQVHIRKFRLARVSLLLLALVGGHALTVPCACGAGQPDKREVVKSARRSYYSLRGHGVSEFQSNVQPNWRVVLKDQLASNPDGAAAALKLLNGIHFTVSLSPTGKVTVEHHADVVPSDAKRQDSFNQIFDGMQQALSGFFDSWSPFMFTSPFPDPEGDYQLEEVGNQYRLRYKDGNADILTAMSKDLVISEIAVASPAFKRIIRPRFANSVQGFLLIGCDASYEGISDGVSVQLKAVIENQEASGVQLPGKLTLRGSYQKSPFEMELAFSNYQVKGR